MNSIRFFLLGKHFICPLALICPLVLNDHFTGLSNLDCRSLLFIILNISCQSVLVCKVSVEKSADSHEISNMYVYCFHQVQEVFCEYFFMQDFNFLHSLFSFQYPHEVNVGMLKAVAEAPQTILIYLFIFPVLIGFFFFYSNHCFDPWLHLPYC